MGPTRMSTFRKSPKSMAPSFCPVMSCSDDAIGPELSGALRRCKRAPERALWNARGCENLGAGLVLRDGRSRGLLSMRPDRKSVVSGKSVSVRVDLGGRRIVKKKKHKQNNHQYTT